MVTEIIQLFKAR